MNLLPMMSVPALAMVVCSCGVLVPSQGQPGDDASPTTLTVYRQLASRIARDALATLPAADTTAVALTVVPRETGWFLENSLIAACLEKGIRPLQSDTAGLLAEFGVTKMHVGYSESRREGLFGPKRVDRTVDLTLDVKMQDRRTGALLVSREFSRELRDTVLVSDLASLETPGLPVTRGELPSEGFFSNLAEPLLAIGAIGVAVFLLFQVKS